MRKSLCLLVAFILCFILVFPVGAESSSNQTNEVFSEISRELSFFEHNQSLIGLSKVDFSNLQISEKIVVYECSSIGFVERANAYMLYEGSSIVSLAYNVMENQYQFMTALAELINRVDYDKIALVYDANGCYVYNGNDYACVYKTPTSISGRESIENASEVELSGLKLCDLKNKQKLAYTSNIINARSQANFFCSVDYVTQQPYNNICWAACVAMISNTVNNTSLSAVDVASAYLGPNFDHYLGTSETTTLMNNTYNLGYTYRDRVPSNEAILTNIQNSTPILARFEDYDTGHAVVIYGINVIAGRIMIIDPSFGSTTCYINENGDYYYVHSGTGDVLTIDCAICKTW